MREIIITQECLDFIDTQDQRVIRKFFYLIEVISELKVINTLFVKKIVNTNFYELRIKSGNEIRVIMFSIDHNNFIEAKKVICLTGFQKKSNKDYKKAIRSAEKILNQYLNP